jgi:hypothetical protein
LDEVAAAGSVARVQIDRDEIDKELANADSRRSKLSFPLDYDSAIGPVLNKFENALARIEKRNQERASSILTWAVVASAAASLAWCLFALVSS